MKTQIQTAPSNKKQQALATTPLLRNGQLPQASWPQLEAYVRGEFQQWVNQTKTVLATRGTNADAVRQAEVRAQKAVNQTGQLLRPVGNAGTQTAPQTKPKSFNDAVDRIINRPMAQTG